MGLAGVHADDALTCLWDRDVMFQIEAGKDADRNGERYLHARCIAKNGAIFGFKPSFERGNRQ